MPVEMPSRASIDCVKAVRLREPLRAHHEIEVQLSGARLRQREANKTATILGHEVDGIRRRHLRGNDEVALVLAIFRIDENDHAAVLHLLDDLFDRRECAAARSGL